jgi:hypothetical protein
VGNVKERGRLGDHPQVAKRSAPQASCSASERWGEAAGSAKRFLDGDRDNVPRGSSDKILAFRRRVRAYLEQIPMRASAHPGFVTLKAQQTTFAAEIFEKCRLACLVAC